MVRNKKIKKLMGPYIHNSKSKTLANRAYYTIIYEDGSKSSILRSRFMMEEHLGRQLLEHEHVDHINNDPTDDRLDNLQVLHVGDHAVKTLTGRPSKQKGMEKGFQHGTNYSWSKKKCDCDLCLQAKATWYKLRNEERRHIYQDSLKPRGSYNMEPALHGTNKMYNKKCRCSLCKKAHADYARETRLKSENKKT